MNPNNRHRRATLRDRARQHRAAARIRRTGIATLAGHCIAAGLRPTQARTVATSLRRNATKNGITGTPGTSYAKRTPARPCTRYTPAQVRAAAITYRPRLAAYKTCRDRLTTAA